MKKSLLTAACYFAGLVLALAQTANDPRQQFAAIGDFKLESGKIIQDCTIGYRTYGKLNSAKTNAILFPTWFGGTTKVLEFVTPWHAIDTTRFYLITADALGNGVSSSPSNSTKQHGSAFPFFTIRDMVETQHQLLAKLGISQLTAVIGISMGGMQTFQWAASYPGIARHFIPIIGSPRPSGYDLMLYNLDRKIIEGDSAFNHGNYTVNPVLAPAAMLLQMAGTTPEYWVKNMSYENFPIWLKRVETAKSPDWNNTYYQVMANIWQDISKTYGGSMQEVANHIKAKMLIIVSKQDHLVNPTPAIEFSKLLPAKLIVLDSNKGHLAVSFGDPQMKQGIIDELAEEK
ncbi:MAG TPA: alpha/beta fold hydrolase [Mucilaginibacter sp.]|jgi:homoserine O-acetyltransferase|nr:alpha/beta fold hydrolase [Mucilaginibacter sp.]